jgi:Tfp pilus assembly protein PilO
MKRENFYSIFFLSLSFLIFFFFISPKQKSIALLNSEISLKRSEFEAWQDYLKRIPEIYLSLMNYQEELSKIDMALPEDPSLPTFFNFLQKIASQSGLLLEHIGLAKVSEEGELKKWTFDLKVKGDYPSFKSLLSNLERSARLIKVEKISFTSLQEPISFSLIISFFSY